MHEPVDPHRPAPFDPRAWIGHPVTGADARPLGLLAAVHADQETGLPAWAVVDDGSGGTAVVPLRDARHDGAALHLPYTVEQLVSAPHPGHAGPLGPDDLAALHRHYAPAPGHRPAAAPPAAPDAGMTRHEERLRAGVETVVTGRVRVRKRLVTEQQTITVPVTREEITVEHDDAPVGLPGPTGAGAPGALLGEQVVELVRHEERVVVTTEVVPVERVRVVRHVVTTPQVVGGVVRREVLDVDEDRAPGR